MVTGSVPLPSAGRSDLTISIIEDDPDAAATTALALRVTPGFRTIVAPDGEAGVQVGLRDRPDVVICDIELPKRDGIAVAEQARRAALNPPPLLLALTGHAGLADRLFAAGFDNYFVKPADPVAAETVVKLRAARRRAGPAPTPPGTPGSPGPG